MAKYCKCKRELTKDNTRCRGVDRYTDEPLCDSCSCYQDKFDELEQEEREFRGRYGYYYG